MPLIPEEPQIHPSVPGPRATPAAGRTAPTPRPVPGPRPGPRAAAPRPAPPRPSRPGANHVPAVPAQRGARPQRAAGSAATPQVQLIPATPEGALDAAEEAVDLLLDAGRAPGDVLVLTTGEQHPWATHELSFGEEAYWAQHDAREDVFYAAATAAGRTAPRPVVVVAVNGGAGDAAAKALPAATAGAGELLILCGDPERLTPLLSGGN
ncbi:hypothetical protein [Streptomyces zingiberis]|uniref:Uncharacterized protein n=1 Tax=Streptomyces zingiberis TaxID=2053010 RepID=A0ABX1C044_9ACTN|nr:hypothetical protein [Streptomyces zingiberis]NJQ01953.1 hypothetical protein [Streptomyces zingiberis]